MSIDSVRMVLGVVGAAVLVALGVRTLWSAFRVRLGGEAESEVASPAQRVRHLARRDRFESAHDRLMGRGLRRSSTAGIASTTESAMAFVAGVGLGSMAWVTLLAVGVAAARPRVKPSPAQDPRCRRRDGHRRVRRAARVADAARELVIRVWLIPFSTNVERVSLALGHKGVAAEPVVVDPSERSELVRVESRQP